MKIKTLLKFGKKMNPAGFLVAVVITLMLTTASFSTSGTAANTNEQASAGGEVRVMKVTAAEIARMPKGEQYVIDLTRQNVVYDIDWTSRPFDPTRVVVKTGSGVLDLRAWLKGAFHNRPGLQPPTRAIAGATEGIKKVLNLGAPSRRTKFSCDKEYCWCDGNADCKDMLSSGICKDGVGTCGGGKQLNCDCDRK